MSKEDFKAQLQVRSQKTKVIAKKKAKEVKKEVPVNTLADLRDSIVKAVASLNEAQLNEIRNLLGSKPDPKFTVTERDESGKIKSFEVT